MSLDRVQRLEHFVDWSAQHITGDEKGQAQIFLDRLLQAFGQPGLLEVGGTPEFRIKKGKDEAGGTSFADYVWKPKVLIEMKKRGTDLARTRQQAFDYWIKLVPNRPQYTVLCNFDEFWIYDFNIDLDEPLDKLTIAEIPQRYDPLAFLFPTLERPLFGNNRVEITRNAADRLASVFGHMVHVRKVDRELAQRFILQMLVALFAEDIDLLPRNFVTNLLADIKSPEDSYDLIGGLFEAMNRAEGTPAGRFKGIRYFNGGLFVNPAKLALDKDGVELAHLRNAAKENWSKVSPDIFGTLFQHSMDQPERHAFGAHYTAPIDIMKIVKPTIVDPWIQLIDNAIRPIQLADLLERLSLYTVLDPACGSGNFLYLAYRELKRLEIKIRDRLRTEFPDFQATIYHVTARQFHGMDILPFAIELAKVTMMLARKLAIDELHIADEPPLPLDNLDQNFIWSDALIESDSANLSGEQANWRKPKLSESGDSKRVSWPRADVIIGNPPFNGVKKLKPDFGADYISAVRSAYKDVPGMAEYCVYWFRRSHDSLPICTPDRPEIGRAGLVGTQNIRNNQSRVGGLDYIVKSGTIVEAVENQPWSGEANVNVSIANWVKTASPSITTQGLASKTAIAPGKLLIPPTKKLWYEIDPKLSLPPQSRTPRSLAVSTTGKRGKIVASKSYALDFREVSFINSALSDQVDVSAAAVLPCNTNPQRVFQGVTPGHKAFVLSQSQREGIINADGISATVIHPYLIGREVLSGDGTPQRFLIDFEQRSLIETQQFVGAYTLIEKKVLPTRLSKASKGKKADGSMRPHHKQFLERWWKLAWDRADMVAEIAKLKNRYLICSRVTKRPVFVFVSIEIRPGDALQTFMFDDDYSFGILQSHAHWLWFTTKCSKLTKRFRYTPESIFDTFPWPQSPTREHINDIAAAGREIRRIRAEALQKMTGGLRALYRALELPGTNPLKSAHAALDSAVLEAYNFDPKADLLQQLLTLNLQVAASVEAGAPVTAPGIPPNFADPQELITGDCIQP